MSDARGSLRPGQQIGNYVLQEQIGAGAFAVVWKAVHHERPGVVRAIKIAIDPAYRVQLRREGRLPEIRHPNVVEIIDSDTRGLHSEPYVVMPYLRGGSLSDLLRRHPGGLPETQVESLMRGLLAGLAAAHQAGIVHRDLKPSNVLLDDAGRPVIVDFGLSYGQAMRAQSVQFSLERSVSGGALIAGTLAYMPPEVRDEGREPTPAADVYAVAVLLFELLTGRRPQGIELPSQVRRDLSRPSYWDALFYWAYQPLEKRYADAARMLAALENGPARPPFAGESVAPRRIELPPPAPLPSDRWEALRLRWSELQAARARLAEADRRRREKLRDYSDFHPEIRAIDEERAMWVAGEKRAEAQFGEVRDGVAQFIETQLRPFEQEWARRTQEGMKPTHPEMQKLSPPIARLGALLNAVRGLPDGPSPLRDMLTEWPSARDSRDLGRIDAFLSRFGEDERNPWAAEALKLRETLRGKLRAARRARALVGALIGIACGLIAGAALGFGLGWLGDRYASINAAQQAVVAWCVGIGVFFGLPGELPGACVGALIGFIFSWVLAALLALPGGVLLWTAIGAGCGGLGGGVIGARIAGRR